LNSQKGSGRIIKKSFPPSVPYELGLQERLRKDPEYAFMLLEECLNDDLASTFLSALRNAIQAKGGFVKMAKALKANRAGLYQAISPKGNPSFATVHAAVRELGYRLDLKKLS
jgi:probable addiction module antidote protein